MKLIKPILKAVTEAGFEKPSPIQEQTIPILLEGRDLLGCAQTGTGKTAAFALPILQNLAKSRSRSIRALILTPTRELAIQINEQIEKYSKYTAIRTGVIFGGVGQRPQVDMLRKGIDILVATPGRLNDLVNQGHIKLSAIEIFVLDEADRMLDMGFIQDIKKIIKQLPSKRQTLLFSATMPKEIEKLAFSMLKNPATVKVAPVTHTIDKINQGVYFVDKGNKILLLASLLKKTKIKNAIVFTNTKHGADKVVKSLAKEGIRALAIHGGKGQNTRQVALNSFKEGKVNVLVATDIAARGIDIAELSHVFNYDLPEVPETYIHRIGRTGRAGKDGVALSFCNIDDVQNLKDIEKHMNKRIPQIQSMWPMAILEKTEKAAKQQGNKKPKQNELISKQPLAQRRRDVKQKRSNKYNADKVKDQSRRS